MSKVWSLVCGLSVVVGTAGQTDAQTAPKPGKLLSILREEVKAARATAHEQFETGYVQAQKAAKSKVESFGWQSMSGPNEAWFVSIYPSYDALEQSNREFAANAALTQAFQLLDEKDSEFRAGQRGVLAEYRDDLSYQPRSSVGELKYMDVTTYRVRPGHIQSFEDVRKMLKAAHEKTTVDEHWAVYQVTSGMPAGTFLFLRGHKSLKELDVDPHPKAYQDAIGDEGRQRIEKTTADDLLSVDSVLFAVSPKMSYVFEETAKMDPSFWKP